MEKAEATEDEEIECGEIVQSRVEKRAVQRVAQPVVESTGTLNPAPGGGKPGPVGTRSTLADGAGEVRLEGEKMAMSVLAVKGNPGPEAGVCGEEALKGNTTGGAVGKSGSLLPPSKPAQVIPREEGIVAPVAKRKTMADIVQETVRDKLSRMAERKANLANPHEGGGEPGSCPVISPSSYDYSSPVSSPIFYYDL